MGCIIIEDLIIEAIDTKDAHCTCTNHANLHHWQKTKISSHTQARMTSN